MTGAEKSRAGTVVAVLPDGKHAFVTTRRKSEALCAECEECGAGFDNNLTFFRSVAQKTWFHERGTGHKRFVYYTVEEIRGGRMTAGERKVTIAGDEATVREFERMARRLLSVLDATERLTAAIDRKVTWEDTERMSEEQIFDVARTDFCEFFMRIVRDVYPLGAGAMTADRETLRRVLTAPTQRRPLSGGDITGGRG